MTKPTGRPRKNPLPEETSLETTTPSATGTAAVGEDEETSIEERIGALEESKGERWGA